MPPHAPAVPAHACTQATYSPHAASCYFVFFLRHPFATYLYININPHPGVCIYKYISLNISHPPCNRLMVTDTWTLHTRTHMRTHMHVHTQCTGHSVSTTLCDPGASSFGQAENTCTLLGREGTAWSLSLLSHGCSAVGSNNPAPDLHRRGGAGCPLARLAPRTAGGTFMAAGARPRRWTPSARAALSSSWILALPAQLRMPSRMAHFIFQLHEGPLQKRVKKRERVREKKKGTKAI